MIIYSKTCADRDYHLGMKALTNLSNAQLEPESCYYYDQHDKSMRNLDFADFVDEVHWDHIRKDPTTKILLHFGGEYFNNITSLLFRIIEIITINFILIH